jgi:DNA-directed RNA polymerase alpha subunit
VDLRAGPGVGVAGNGANALAEASGGSDALVDAIVPWGDAQTIAERVRAHHDAGADHLCVQPVTDTASEMLEHLRVLAPALIDS